MPAFEPPVCPVYVRVCQCRGVSETQREGSVGGVTRCLSVSLRVSPSRRLSHVMCGLRGTSSPLSAELSVRSVTIAGGGCVWQDYWDVLPKCRWSSP